jgi:CheY-like chemotaxis protein
MLTVLIAADEFAILDAVSHALAESGYRVLRAGDGADALRLLVSHPCDVVICDEVRPLMTGRQLVTVMRADPRFVAIPVILMVDGGRSHGEDGADVRVLQKPVALAELTALVGDVTRPRGPDS